MENQIEIDHEEVVQNGQIHNLRSRENLKQHPKYDDYVCFSTSVTDSLDEKVSFLAYAEDSNII